MPPPEPLSPEPIRALAAQVATGDVSVSDALEQLRRTSQTPPTPALRWSWEPLVRALLALLDDNTFLTAVDTLGVRARGSRLGSRCIAFTAEELAPFADLLLAGELLVYSGRAHLDRRDPRVRSVLRALIPLIEDYTDVSGPRWVVGERARELAWAFPDVEVALAALEFFRGTAWVTDCGMVIDDMRLGARSDCMRIVASACGSHLADIEPRLVELLTRSDGGSDLQAAIMSLMGAVGDRASLDAICRYVATPGPSSGLAPARPSRMPSA
jgi:hypothetical protein